MTLAQSIRLAFPVLLSCTLAACGGDGGFTPSGTSSNPSTGTPAGGTTPSTTSGTAPTTINSKCTITKSGASPESTVTTPSVTEALDYTALECITTLTTEELAYTARFKNLNQIKLTGEDINLTGLPLFSNLIRLDINAPSLYPTNFSDLSELSKQPRLTYLTVHGHAITDLTPLASILTLKEVIIMGDPKLLRRILKDADPLKNLTALNTVTLPFNGLTNINFASSLDVLKTLRVSENKIESLVGLEGLNNIEEVSIQKNKIHDLSPLANLTSLKQLDLISNRIDDINPLSNLTNLSILGLFSNCININQKNILPSPFNEAANQVLTENGQVADCSVYDDRDPELMQMGEGSGGGFSKGTLDITIPTLIVGGKTAVTATLVGPTGNYSDREAIVSFTSPCIVNGTSLITGPITTSNGISTSEYTAKSCLGTDEVTASTTIDGIAFSAKSTITIVPPTIGSMEFQSSTPSSVGLSGFGLNETSAVTFIVKDKQGNPVANRQVSFELSTSNGGITLDPPVALSNSDGVVSTTVKSGTVATTVRVTATVVENPSIKTQSEGLTISTGVADQDSFTLGASVFNVEGWDFNGKTSEISIRAGDHFNNPVSGASVYFTTEGGNIDPECTTNKQGECTVTWRSSNPRPADGRVTILATMLGEESFVDSTGNRVLNDAPDNFTDLPEAFLDKNENGEFDPGEDEPRDFNGNGQWDDKDGQYNGILCDANNVTNLCSTEKNTYVRESIVLIMSSSNVNINILPVFLDATNGSVSTNLIINDINNQAIPAGSTISISMVGGGSILSASNITVPNTTLPIEYPVIIQGEEVEVGVATFLDIKVTTPSGLITNKQFPVVMKVK